MTTLYLDLETCPESATVGMDLDHPPGWEPVPFAAPEPPTRRSLPSNIRKAETIERWEADEDARHAEALAGHDAYVETARAAHEAAQGEAARKWYGKQSLDPMAGRILCLGWAVDDGDPEVLSGGEREILREFAGVLETHKPAAIVAHNGDRFDFPFLANRAIKRSGFSITKALKLHAKPWERPGVDTRALWPVVRDYFGRPASPSGMSAIIAFLGLERPDNPIDGSEVLEAYVAGRLDEIVAHCLADVRDLREVHRVLQMAGVAP